MKKYINKQIKIREKNLRYDFLPSMIEIIEKPSNRLGIVIMFLIFTMIIATVAWAAACKVDIVVTASGTVMPEGGVAVINAVTTGQIDEICIDSGDYVRKGDVLLRLDSGDAERNYTECVYNLEVLNLQRDIYGEVYDALSDDEGYDKAIEIDIEKYGEYSYIAEAVLLEHELFVSALDKVYSYSDKESMRNEQKLKVLQNINTLDTKIEAASLSLEGAENELKKYEVFAQQDGKVILTDTIYEGMLTDSSITLGYIIPVDEENIFTVYVANKDIEDINEGDRVGVKIAAYNDTAYEYMEGEVVSIGDIALNMENAGSVYEVKIYIEGLPDDIKLGLEGSCDIIIGERTVLDYFLEPFKEGLDSSLREK